MINEIRYLDESEVLEWINEGIASNASFKASKSLSKAMYMKMGAGRKKAAKYAGQVWNKKGITKTPGRTSLVNKFIASGG